MATDPSGRSSRMDEATDLGDAALGPAFMAAVASVALSWTLYLMGERQKALFVGLWPPTVLAFASYVRQRRVMKTVEDLSRPVESVRETIGAVMP